MLTPTPTAYQPYQNMTARLEKIKAFRQQLAAAGIQWPPAPWQRVEITGNRYKADPAGRLLGTVLRVNGGYYYVLPDCQLASDPYPRECYAEELAPVFDDVAPGWVPYGFWVREMSAARNRSANFDLVLNMGTWAFECFPKALVTGDFQFQAVGKPYTRYNHTSIIKLRPSHY